MTRPAIHSVAVERQRLRFAAGHFATFADELEPIHGHNYDVFVEVQGRLTAESWVVDFSLLKRLAREICETLDHKFLLQMTSNTLSIKDDGSHYEIQYRDQPPYRLPKRDVAPLPIDNTTAERLSQYIANQLAESLGARPDLQLANLKVGVEEMPGQAAWYQVDLPLSDA